MLTENQKKYSAALRSQSPSPVSSLHRHSSTTRLVTMLAAPRLGSRVLRTILSYSITSNTSINSNTSRQQLSTTSSTRRKDFFTAKHEYVKIEGNTGQSQCSLRSELITTNILAWQEIPRQSEDERVLRADRRRGQSLWLLCTGQSSGGETVEGDQARLEGESDLEVI